jgi:HEPN domain-containing protein
MMNERIQALALQAGKYADETQPRGSYTRDGMWLYAYNEKFAELLLQECLFKINGAKIRNESYAELIERIKEDFGVES